MTGQLERIARTRTRLTEIMPFFGRLVLYLRPRLAEPDDNVPQMAVGPDGTLVVDEEFCEGLEDPELAACLIHEVMHVAFLFWDRLQNRMPYLFNLAQDHAINLIIRDIQNGNIFLPSWLIYNEEFVNLSAEEIYEILYKKRKSAKEKNRAMLGDCRADLVSTEIGQLTLDGDVSAIRKLSSSWRDRVVEASYFHEKCKGRGTLPESITREINKLTNPRLTWLDRIKSFVGEFGRRCEYSFRAPSRRSESVGEYLPSRYRTLTHVAILIDSSASISRDALTQAVSEVGGICEELEMSVRVIVVDADIQSDAEIIDAEEISITGNGGSDFRPAFSKLEDDGFSGIVIAFTDGDITVPGTKPETFGRVMWVIGQHDKPPTRKWGEIVRMPAL